MIGYSNEYGNVSYTDDVLAKIVGLSTMECYGVVGMVSKSATEGLLGVNENRKFNKRRKNR